MVNEQRWLWAREREPRIFVETWQEAGVSEKAPQRKTRTATSFHLHEQGSIHMISFGAISQTAIVIVLLLHDHIQV